MATRNWNKDRAQKRIDTKIDGLLLKDIEIKDYKRETNLADLKTNVAYRVDGVHLYVDILNLREMLNATGVEGETVHKNVLRFLNLHYRAVERILNDAETLLVDFHNQRLHAVVIKPYDSAKERVQKAVAIGQVITDVLARTGEEETKLPAAKVRIGIDTGIALAVNNGRRGHREPLFLGQPANHAAKRAGGGTVTGIYLTNIARKELGLSTVENEDKSPLTAQEIQTQVDNAKLEITADKIVKAWSEDLKAKPIGEYVFSAHRPPYRDLDPEKLSAGNSKRQDAASIYADLDGFTNYVSKNISDDTSAKHVVRALHVLRSELDAVLHTDFAGRKIRFIGDCVHGLTVEGTDKTTDAQETISNLTLCAAAMRSSFKLAQERLKAKSTNADALGLAIGFDYGPMTVTRLGMKGDLIRCSVSRGVVSSEDEQKRCKGTETAIGATAYKNASDAVKAVFGENRLRANLDYEKAVKELSAKADRAAKATEALDASLLKPAAAVVTPFAFPNKPAAPGKPAGFA